MIFAADDSDGCSRRVPSCKATGNQCVPGVEIIETEIDGIDKFDDPQILPPCSHLSFPHFGWIEGKGNRGCRLARIDSGGWFSESLARSAASVFHLESGGRTNGQLRAVATCKLRRRSQDDGDKERHRKGREETPVFRAPRRLLEPHGG